MAKPPLSPASGRVICSILCCTLILLVTIPAYTRANTWYPPGYDQTGRSRPASGHSPTDKHGTEQQSSFNPLVQGVRFFQEFISPVDSPRCTMYPTCSTYALEALRRHGPALGSFITVDRLLHEASPAEQRHPLKGFERLRYYSPLSANDFWLDSGMPTRPSKCP